MEESHLPWESFQHRLQQYFADAQKDGLFKELKEKMVSRAAILIPLFFHHNEVFVLLTKRADHLKTHSGEVCFPGGKYEENDGDLVNTALREAEEEIGLKPSNVRILSEFVPLCTIRSIAVFPFVGVIKDLEKVKLNLNCEEVEKVFACPLKFFINSQSYALYGDLEKKFHSFSWENNVSLNNAESKIDFLKQVFGESGHKTFFIWGLTAHFAILIAAVCFDLPPSFKNITYTIDGLLKSVKSYLRQFLRGSAVILTKL